MALRRARLRSYQPYEKQRLFHSLSATHRERALLAGNRVGKTWCAGMEIAIHATGRYPSWWEGRRFPGPTKWWVANSTNETTRDNPQRILLGEFYDQGTGSLPAIDIVKVILGRGIADQVDKLLLRHQGGGISQIQFKAFDQRRERWQGEQIHGVWFDEEPELEIYSEGLTRTNTTEYGPGIAMLTATPLLGMTDVVGQFYPKPSSRDRALIQMDLSEAGHFSAEDREKIEAQYQPWELEARTKGIPLLGSGRIFQIPEAALVEDPIEVVPQHWRRIIGLDFGWDHPTAAVDLAWEEAVDCLHVLHEYKQAEQTPIIHAASIKPWGADRVPVAWPHDAHQTDKQSGISTADAYRRQGLAMLPDHATFEAGGYGLSTGLDEMRMRMQTGRLKVSRLCSLWIDEFRTYHVKDGKVVKQKDDLLDATRAGMMMLRFSANIAPVHYPHSLGRYDPFSAANSGYDERRSLLVGARGEPLRIRED